MRGRKYSPAVSLKRKMGKPYREREDDRTPDTFGMAFLESER